MEMFVEECLDNIKNISEEFILNNKPIIRERRVSGKWFSRYVRVEIDNDIDCYGCINFSNIIKINLKKHFDDSLEDDTPEEMFQEISITIFHELIHALDPKKYLPYRSKKSYYFRPMEIDALIYSNVYHPRTLTEILESTMFDVYSKNKHVKRKILKTFYKQKETKCR